MTAGTQSEQSVVKHLRLRNRETKAGQVLDGLDIRRPSQPPVGTVKEMFARNDQVIALGPRFNRLLNERRTLNAIEADNVPIPATCDREGYCGDDHLLYWFGGLADLRMIQRLAPSAKFTNVLDFGGATGRFARHIPLHFPNANVTITDLNVNHVEWVGRYFGQGKRILTDREDYLR